MGAACAPQGVRRPCRTIANAQWLGACGEQDIAWLSAAACCVVDPVRQVAERWDLLVSQLHCACAAPHRKPRSLHTLPRQTCRPSRTPAGAPALGAEQQQWGRSCSCQYLWLAKGLPCARACTALGQLTAAPLQPARTSSGCAPLFRSRPQAAAAGGGVAGGGRAPGGAGGGPPRPRRARQRAARPPEARGDAGGPEEPGGKSTTSLLTAAGWWRSAALQH